jgi:hypothetical protein
MQNQAEFVDSQFQKYEKYAPINKDKVDKAKAAITGLNLVVKLIGAIVIMICFMYCISASLKFRKTEWTAMAKLVVATTTAIIMVKIAVKGRI